MALLKRPAGTLAALLALWAQLVLATILPHPAAAATLADLLDDPGAICHAGGTPAQPHHPASECPLCPACATLHHVQALPVAPPPLPQRRAGAIGASQPPAIALLTPPALGRRPSRADLLSRFELHPPAAGRW